MKLNKIISIIFAAMLIFSIAAGSYASGVYYLPDVRGEMSSPSYWTKDTQLLMSFEEIEEQNKKTVSTKEACMYDLKNQTESFDGIALNDAIKKSSLADANYYLGWTYLEESKLASQEDYNLIIENTQNPEAKRTQNILYAVAVKRSELRTFPSYTAIWDDPNDPDFDYQYLASVRVNEPLVITSVSKDGLFYLAKSICCSGWISADSVAICKDKNEWLSSWDLKNEESLVVWGDKVYMETSLFDGRTSDLMLTMGTVLKLADTVNPNNLIDNRSAYNNYAVWLPVRNEDGSFSQKLGLISEHKKVSAGYLPLTGENISKVAFSALGNTYGWGGSLNSDDCSGYMRNVYKCFGLELARNTTWQSSMPMAKADMQHMCKEERLELIESLPFGTILYFNGHEMMYLGSENGKHYVISAISTIMQPENPSLRQRIRSVVINTLDVKRANGNTWLEDLSLALVPYCTPDDKCFADYKWYHDGVAYCLENGIMHGDENKFFNPDDDISWAEVLQIFYNIEYPDAELFVSSDGEWYNDAVGWAKKSLFKDMNDIEFNPAEAISREEIAFVVYLYACYKDFDTSKLENEDLHSYSDIQNITPLFVDAVKYAVSVGFIKGKTPDTLNPYDNTSRAEMAVIIQRFFQNIQSEQ